MLALPLWGWLGAPFVSVVDNPFIGGQGWAAAEVAGALASGRWPDPVSSAGFPGVRAARFLGWPVLLAGVIAVPVLGAGLWVQIAAWAGLALGAGAAAWVFGPPRGGLRAAAAGVVFGLAPVAVGALASGQLENTQTWLVPGLVAAVGRARGAAGALGAGAAGLLAGLASPYLGMIGVLAAVFVPRRRGAALGAAVLGLAAAGAWLAPGEVDPLFAPRWTGGAEVAGDPAHAASLDGLLLGAPAGQVRTLVLHLPYLGLPAVLAVLAWGPARRAGAGALAAGAVLALGPRLRWAGELLRVGGASVALPAAVLAAGVPSLGQSGQFYRFALLAAVGLARGVGRLPVAAAVLVAALSAADTLRVALPSGTPWPTRPLPVEAWAAWAADPQPGAVLHLPRRSPHTPPNHPVRLLGVAHHGRAVTDLPRSTPSALETPALALVERCTRAGGACPVPSRAQLAGTGVRYVVLDLDPSAERETLARRLRAAWGEPDGAAAGLWWWHLP